MYVICNIFNMQSSQSPILSTVLQIYYSTGISIIGGIKNAILALKLLFQSHIVLLDIEFLIKKFKSYLTDFLFFCAKTTFW